MYESSYSDSPETVEDTGASTLSEARRQGIYGWRESLDFAIANASSALLALQHDTGYWCFELEADCTIPAEYILMMHFMDEIDESLQDKFANYLRAHQQEGGGWPLYYEGAFDLSCTVKAYYALKLAGDDPDAAHMQRARQLILANGGAARANVFTRLTLAMFDQIPWRGVPYVPVEIMLLPQWFFFHLSKVSYWSRTVMVPLAVLYSLRARARNPRGVGIPELFTIDPQVETNYFSVRSRINWLFLILERSVRRFDRWIPRALRRNALKRAEAWFIERLNGEDGLGAIFPAMVNAHQALALLGYPADHPHRRQTKAALKKLVIEKQDEAYCQPCVSPVWDTALATLALVEADADKHTEPVQRALDWLVDKQVDQAVSGDWKQSAPTLPSGGWAFQFENPHYPDLDDTAVVAWAMHRADASRYRLAVDKATEWIVGMQSRNGGFAAFDADNNHFILNEIPFADHGALLDPPTSDVSARCLTLLGMQSTEGAALSAKQAVIRFLQSEQESSGAWFGRWGSNYIYGTWSVLVALNQAGVPNTDPMVRNAVSWLKRCQRPDGGWGETNDSYEDTSLAGQADRSTSFQTAWAMLGLMAAGEAESEAVQRGAEYLLTHQQTDGLWHDPEFTAPGFPRVFYLKYHGYDKYFPLWALARYRRLREGRAH
jgi:squalene-hopene/tetraprenyl-beta-curcumene cyclase